MLIVGDVVVGEMDFYYSGVRDDGKGGKNEAGIDEKGVMAREGAGMASGVGEGEEGDGKLEWEEDDHNNSDEDVGEVVGNTKGKGVECKNEEVEKTEDKTDYGSGDKGIAEMGRVVSVLGILEVNRGKKDSTGDKVEDWVDEVGAGAPEN